MRRDNPEAEPLELEPERPLPAPAAVVIAALAPLILEERLARIEAVVAHRVRSVIPVLEAVDDPRNVAAILRTSDAFGLQEVQLIERTQPFLASRRVTQGAERWLAFVRHRSPAECVASLRQRGFQVYVATMRSERTPEELRGVAQLALVFGNERDGASAELQALCDGEFTVPMRGFSRSLNVSVAAAVALHTVASGRSGELGAEERDALRARFMLLSVERAEQVVAEHCARHER